MKKEEVEVEERAIRYIAKAADGSMRDALSLLDQCIAFHIGEKLTYDKVLSVLGAVDTDVYSALLRRMIDRDVKGVLQTVNDLVMEGKELAQLTTDFTWYLRNLLLAKSSDNMEDVLDVSTENLAQLKEEAQMIENDALMRYIRIFSDLSNQLKYATQKRVLLEVALIRICVPQMETRQDTILERIRALEEKVEKGLVAQAPPQGYRAADGPTAQEMPGEMPVQPREVPKALPEDVKEVVKNFRMIANDASGMLKVYLRQARLSVGNAGQLQIILPDDLAAGVVGTEDHKKEIQDLIVERTGKKVEIEVGKVEQGRRFEDSYIDLEQLIHMDITVED